MSAWRRRGVTGQRSQRQAVGAIELVDATVWPPRAASQPPSAGGRVPSSCGWTRAGDVDHLNTVEFPPRPTGSESDLIFEAYYEAFRTDLGLPAPDLRDRETTADE
jgi:hypothetical protein